MEIGLLLPYNEKAVEENAKKNKPVVLGVELKSMYDEINLLEVKHGYNTAAVLSELKLSLMVALGKAQVEHKEEGNNDGNKSN